MMRHAKSAILAACATVLTLGSGCASTPSGAGLSLGPDLSSVCRSIANSLECARAIERVQLDRDRRVVRRGDTLRLPLDRGDSVVLRDHDVEGETAIWYSYREHLPRLRAYVVHVQYYEGDGYLLIDEVKGQQTPIHAPPIVSPNGQRFLTISEDLFAGYNPNAIQIWMSTATGFVLEWSYRPTDAAWGPAEGRWVSDREIRVRQATVGENGSRELAGEVVVERRDDGWHWRVEPR